MRLFLACTPRTGNLWMRRVLIHALDLPQYVGHNPDEIPWNDLPERCLVAMHWHRSDEFAAFLRANGFTTLVTARHPFDVLLSILHFTQIEPTARWLEGEAGDESQLAGADPTSAAFAEYCLGPRAAALLSISPEWLGQAAATIRYEDFLTSPAAAATRAFEAIGASPVNSIDDAFDRNSVGNLRSIAPKHVWRARSGDWRRVITASLAHQIAARHPDYFRAFGYACDPDPLLDAWTVRRNWDAMLTGASSEVIGAPAYLNPAAVDGIAS